MNGRPQFYLAKRPNRFNEKLIMMYFQWTPRRGQNNRLYYSTKMNIIQDHWNSRTQRPRQISGFEVQYMQIAEHLDKMTIEVMTIYRKYITERRILDLTKEALRDELDSIYINHRPIAGVGFLEWVEDYLINIYPKSAKFNKGTFSVMNSLKAHVNGFADHIGYKPDFHQWKESLFSEFVVYLRSKKLSDNTISKIVFTALKSILKEAKKAGINDFDYFEKVLPRDLRVVKTKGDKIYLTRTELKALYECEMSGHTERVRDCFICAALLGLRHSDWSKINKENIITLGGDVKVLYVLTKKTEKRVVLPLHPVVLAILEKYNGALPVISNAKSNEYLKEVGQIAGMDSTVKKTIRRGRIEESNHSKFELLTTHVARNSFESNARGTDIPQRDIDKFTGHSSGEISDIYDRRELETIAKKYCGHRFFTTWED